MKTAGSFVAVLRVTCRGKGYKGPREASFSSHSRPSPRSVCLQPDCSLKNAPSYVQLFPKRFTRAVQYGSVHPRCVPSVFDLHLRECTREYSTSSSMMMAMSSSLSQEEVCGDAKKETDAAPYSCALPSPPVPKKERGGKVTVLTLASKRQAGVPLTMVTAYDTPSARLADEAGVDMVLVGDSVGMVALGHKNTVSVTMQDMVHHCRAVAAAGMQQSMLIGDLPFGSYLTVEDALKNASRLMKEGGVDAVKLEGGKRVAHIVSALVQSGIVVFGHIGLCPQTSTSLGGFRVQGKTFEKAKELYEDAKALERAGACAIVMEMIPSELAEFVTQNLSVPTIGIGAGPKTSGQVLVWHDLLGLYPHPPRFVKQMANVAEVIRGGLKKYIEEVHTGQFPAPQHSTSAPSSLILQLQKEIFPPSPSDLLDPKMSSQTHFTVSHRKGEECHGLPLLNFLSSSPIVVIGGGSMGTLFASRLSAHSPVLLISNYNKHIDTIRQNGIQVTSLTGFGKEREGEGGREREKSGGGSNLLAVCDVEGEILKVLRNFSPFVFVLTSGNNTEKAADVAKKIVKENGVVITLQNGLGNEDILGKAVGRERVLIGVTSQSAYLEEPGRLFHSGVRGMTVLLPSPSQIKATEDVRNILDSAGFPVAMETDKTRAAEVRWKKLAVNAIVNPLTALLRVANGELLSQDIAKSLLPQLSQEISSVALRSENVSLTPQEVEREVVNVVESTKDNFSSMCCAVKQGRPIEIDQISGALSRLGQSCGVATPISSLLYSLLQRQASLNSLSFSPLSLMRAYSTSSIRTPKDTRLIHDPKEISAYRKSLSPSLRVGFVPTMGALHDGHLDLVREAGKHADVVVSSIFVNPKQFGPSEDFSVYPRTLEEDMVKLRSTGVVDAVFAPKAEDIYPSNPPHRTFVDVEGFDTHGEGFIRPGFFRGVSTVCTVLMNLVRPDIAFFGQKDGMQCLVLRQITRDLHMGVDICVVPTARERTGLARSSRNVYLSPFEREVIAPKIYHSLCSVKNALQIKTLEIAQVRRMIEEELAQEPLLSLQYVTVTDWNTAVEVRDPSFPLSSSSSSSSPSFLLAVAVKLGNTRLIDNILI